MPPSWRSIALLVILRNAFLFLLWCEEREIAAAGDDGEEENSAGESSTDTEEDAVSGETNCTRCCYPRH